MILYWIVCIALAAVLGAAFYAYRTAFFSPMKGRGEVKPIQNPSYDPYRPEMRRIYKALNERPYESVTITSHDGLTLHGRYYHVKDGAPLDIGFHGYKSFCIVDFSGGCNISFETGHNLLLVDQRAHGKSQGYTIAFGLKERHDLLKWLDYAIARFGQEIEIFLYGVSMGGATVLMASEMDLPKNVKAIIADCPYGNALDIILEVGKSMPIPTWIMKPMVILGARIFGGFDLLETDAVRAVKHTKVPILIIHGDGDTFVPISMSKAVADANPDMVTHHTIAGAEHGISYLVDTVKYKKYVADFMASLPQ